MLLYGKRVFFLETKWIFQKLLVDAVNQMNTWSFMNIKGQGHSLILVQCHLNSTFSNFFFLETAVLIEAKFHMEPPWNGGMKMSMNG